MSIDLGNVDAGITLYIPFHTFDSNGASITLTGLAVTDIEIYKNGSVTQRSSDAGYTLLDTDGIDFDGITGIHGFSIDLADNTDAGFYSAGAFYWVVVSAVTIDTRTVNFVAATFRIGPAATNVTQWLGTAAATPTVAGVPEVDVTHWRGTAVPAEHTAGYPIVTVKDGAGTGEINTNAGKVVGVELVDTLTTYTGNTPQTGDSFARLGAPAGASMSADIAAIEAQTDDIGVAGAGLTALGDARLANLDATISSRLATAGYTVPPTTAENADKLLGRNLAGGSDGGRTVKDALRVLRNKRSIAAGTLTVTIEDDVTAAWTAAVTTAVSDPVSSVDPA